MIIALLRLPDVCFNSPSVLRVFCRQKWVTALELAKARAVRIADSDDDDFADRDINSDKTELQSMLKNLVTKLEDLRTCHDLIIKHGSALQRSLTELEQIENPTEALSKSKSVNERATLFRITSNAMINACGEYLTLAQTHGRKWQRLLQHEHETRLRLEEMVEQLAKQHSHLEARSIRAIQEHSANTPKVNSPGSDDEDEFFDAEEQNTDFYVSFPGGAHRITSPGGANALGPRGDRPSNTKMNSTEQDDLSSGSDNSDYSSDPHDGNTDMGVVTRRPKGHRRKVSQTAKECISGVSPSTAAKEADTSGESSQPSSAPGTPRTLESGEQRSRRTRIPERPNQSLNLWSIMKNCIGKELTKIPMPVSSFLHFLESARSGCSLMYANC